MVRRRGNTLRSRANNDAVVDVSDNVDISKLTVGKRVTLLSDSYKLEKMLPSSVDPLVSLMMVERFRIVHTI